MEVITAETAGDWEAWDGYVRASPRAVHYHLSGWKRVLEATYGNKTAYLMARRDGVVCGILPLALVAGFPATPHLASLPYLSYAGLCTDDAAAEDALLARAEEYRQRFCARYVELHNTEAYRGTHSRLTTNHDKLRMVLALPSSSEELWKRLDAKVRNQTRKATKSGLRVETGGVEHLDAFYHVFAQNMRDLGSPVHRKMLLRSLFEVFPNDVRLVMVFKEALPVGGAVLLTFRDMAEVPWASSRREFFRDCPNNLLYWEILRRCCDAGLHEFDFGRSTRDSGTYRFKEQWGAQPVPLYWQFHLPKHVTPPDPTHSGVLARLVVRVWQRLPLSVANALGPHLRGRISA